MSGRLAIIAIALIAFTAACGTTSVTPTPPPSATPSASATVSPSTAPASGVIYYARDRLPPIGARLLGAGTGATAETRIFSRLDALYTGGAPSGAFNVVSRAKARPGTVTVAGDLATIDFAVPNDDWGIAGSAGLRAFLQQVVYTASEEPQIRRVLLTQNGGKQAVIGGEGLVVDHPATREDVAGYAVRASVDPIRSFEGAVPTVPIAEISSRYSVDQIAPGLARLEVTLDRAGAEPRWLPTFEASITKGDASYEAIDAKWLLDLVVYDGADVASNEAVLATPLRRVVVEPDRARHATRYRLALDDLRPWRVGVAFAPVRIFVDVGGDPGAVNANVAVYRPLFGEKAATALTLSGLVRAFEATYVYRVTDASGRSLLTRSAAATYGTSAIWGAFDVAIPDVPPTGANVEVYLVSPRDGEVTDLVTVPISHETRR